MASTTQDTTGYSVEFACSICGRKRSYPDEMVLSDDGLFRCTVGNGCDERTAYSVDRERAAFRPRPEMVPPKGGPLPIGDVRDTEEQFIDRAYQRAASLLGWSGPSVAYVDTCDVPPYRAGSLWVARNTSGGAGTLSDYSISNGALLLSSGTVAPASRDLSNARNRLSAPLGGGKGYAAFDITCTSAKGTNAVFFGISASFFPALVGYSSASANFALFTGSALVQLATSSVAVDSADHKAELWWSGGTAYASIDEEPAFSGAIAATSGSGPASPFIRFVMASGEVTVSVRTMLWLGE